MCQYVLDLVVDDDGFDPLTAEPGLAYVRVADGITADIRSGRIPVGGRLPRETALAEEYGVSHGTIRHALAMLRERRLVRTFPGRGTYVVAKPDDNESKGSAGA